MNFKKRYFDNRLLYLFIALFVLAASLQTACNKEAEQPPEGSSDYGKGVLICNEGLFPNGAGSISFFNRQTKAVTNNLFETVNNRPLGNTVQSVHTHNNQTFIVVSNAGRVEVVNAANFTTLATIENLQLPRYFWGINNNKAYITQWGANGLTGSVQVLNLQTMQVTKTVPLSKGPEMMAQAGNRIFIPCEGGYDFENYDNRVAVIDVLVDELLTYIEVPDYPNSIVTDANGFVWVLCGGIITYNPDWTVNEMQSTKGALVKIDAAANAVATVLEFPQVATSGNLTVNAAGTVLYYDYNGQIYAQSVTDNTLNTQPFIAHSYYGMAVDPQENLLYGADAKDYQSNGSIVRHRLTDGAPVDTFTVGVIPNSGFFFSE
ncbi:hypothetical protein C7N43_08160 [Sphingobacteriales bacterium UPWRP_1]|nr:hypothetical protein B6N25_11095 [Sphingobacteriales bacterium TSM_CSS]PSJ77529.1 hypothetical protein C7N43_08160 [Sphingobacteriales bacterium UPWRP_1]